MSSVKFNIVDYLTIESLEDGLEVYFSNDIEYGIDGEGWRKLTAFKTIKIDTGQTVSFRGNLKPSYTNGIGTFNVTKNFNLKGTAMSMLFGDQGKDNFSLIGYDSVFYTLFQNCSTLKSIASNFLPATTLADYCYESMFSGCSSLTTAPTLPATTLANYCYNGMFQNCKSLTTAPALPATTLADDCYIYMFQNCSKLNYIKAMFTTTPSSYYTGYWVRGVASTGTFVKNPEATWDVVGDSGVPEGWTVKFDGEE